MRDTSRSAGQRRGRAFRDSGESRPRHGARNNEFQRDESRGEHDGRRSGSRRDRYAESRGERRENRSGRDGRTSFHPGNAAGTERPRQERPAAPVEKAELELTLNAFSPDGRCVARREGQPVVFVQGGLAGQKVLASVNMIAGKRMLEGEVLKVLEPVPAEQGGERPSPCPHAEECGGCPWQALPYASQLQWKARLVREALERIGRLRLPDEVYRGIIPSSPEWGFRNKMEFAFAPDAEGCPLLGLRRRSSHEVVEVTDCLLVSPRMMKALCALREACKVSGLSAWDGEYGYLRHAVLREAGSVLLAELITAPSLPDQAAAVQRIGEKLLADGLAGGFVHSERRALSAVAYGEHTRLCLGTTSLAEELRLPQTDGGHKMPLHLRLDHASFFQVNSSTASLLYGEALNMALELLQSSLYWVPGNALLPSCFDVYCGVGGLALTMAPYFERVFGLESVAPAIKLARENAAFFPQARFACDDASRLGEYFRRHGTPTLLVCDPPRAGMDERVTQAILKARPEHIVLVSCNPATLARDLGRLAGGSEPAYAVRAVRPVDMFPQTPHVETVVTLIRL